MRRASRGTALIVVCVPFRGWGAGWLAPVIILRISFRGWGRRGRDGPTHSAHRCRSQVSCGVVQGGEGMVAAGGLPEGSVRALQGRGDIRLSIRGVLGCCGFRERGLDLKDLGESAEKEWREVLFWLQE